MLPIFSCPASAFGLSWPFFWPVIHSNPRIGCDSNKTHIEADRSCNLFTRDLIIDKRACITNERLVLTPMLRSTCPFRKSGGLATTLTSTQTSLPRFSLRLQVRSPLKALQPRRSSLPLAIAMRTQHKAHSLPLFPVYTAAFLSPSELVIGGGGGAGRTGIKNKLVSLCVTTVSEEVHASETRWI
jgi:hypothetical protein